MRWVILRLFAHGSRHAAMASSTQLPIRLTPPKGVTGPSQLGPPRTSTYRLPLNSTTPIVMAGPTQFSKPGCVGFCVCWFISRPTSSKQGAWTNWYNTAVSQLLVLLWPRKFSRPWAPHAPKTTPEPPNRDPAIRLNLALNKAGLYARHQAAMAFFSFFIAFFSIWRMRSADTPYSAANSCSVVF